MVTWDYVPLKDQTFIPRIGGTAKSILLQHYFIVFNDSGTFTEQIVVFDLKEKQWLKVKLNGDYLNLKEGLSICLYDNSTIVMFGTDGTEDVLSLLSFNRGFDGSQISCLAFLINISTGKEVQIYHDLTRLQNRLLKSYHSASIFDDQMYLYGGSMNNAVHGDLSVIDLT